MLKKSFITLGKSYAALDRLSSRQLHSREVQLARLAHAGPTSAIEGRVVAREISDIQLIIEARETKPSSISSPTPTSGSPAAR